MRLAIDDITVTLAGCTPVVLRPSLRAASRLERKYGWAKIAQAIDNRNLTTMADVIRQCATERTDIPRFLESLDGMPLGAALHEIATKVAEIVLAFTATDDDRPRRKGSGKPITYAQHYTDLYRIATGWLHWTPETAWNATPREIEEAFAGRLDMLKAIHGSGDDPEPQSDMTAAEYEALKQQRHDSAGLAKLKAMSGRKRAA